VGVTSIPIINVQDMQFGQARFVSHADIPFPDCGEMDVVFNGRSCTCSVLVGVPSRGVGDVGVRYVSGRNLAFGVLW